MSGPFIKRWIHLRSVLAPSYDVEAIYLALPLCRGGPPPRSSAQRLGCEGPGEGGGRGGPRWPRSSCGASRAWQRGRRRRPAMGGSDTLWQLQGSLRKSGLALPGGLLFVASGVVLYQHIAPHSDYPMRIWLTLILATMLPLAYIDMVIPGCGDPLGLLRKYGAKTLLMHMVFLVLRLRLLLHTERDTMLLNAINVGGLVSVTLALHFGYNILSCLSDHYDVLYYVGAAVVVAIITEVVGAIVGQAFEVDNLRSGVIPAQVEQFIMATGNFVEAPPCIARPFLRYISRHCDVGVVLRVRSACLPLLHLLLGSRCARAPVAAPGFPFSSSG
ncbi:unnamed protein product [Prorocentrum cordatum]|uniref:Uncharacterized protein n=1 Tax=Prorocentrum cordatum TaxID=2364126 RepID=A0ABN9WT39_9DINO|nr:unnamed protein product [Polarella glacialis]